MDGSSSSIITRVNGMVVVTQVFPGAEAPGPAGSSAPPSPDSPRYDPVKVSEMTAAFLRGQPQLLGVRRASGRGWFLGTGSRVIVDATCSRAVISIII